MCQYVNKLLRYFFDITIDFFNDTWYYKDTKEINFIQI
nr:MAG TPA: hypothetical protein [Caudoviricetes sp.]